jgi:hypothetical protein
LVVVVVVVVVVVRPFRSLVVVVVVVVVRPFRSLVVVVVVIQAFRSWLLQGNAESKGTCKGTLRHCGVLLHQWPNSKMSRVEVSVLKPGLWSLRAQVAR